MLLHLLTLSHTYKLQSKRLQWLHRANGISSGTSASPPAFPHPTPFPGGMTPHSTSELAPEALQVPRTLYQTASPNCIRYIQSSRPNAAFPFMIKGSDLQGSEERCTEAKTQGIPSLLPVVPEPMLDWRKHQGRPNSCPQVLPIYLAAAGYKSRATQSPIHS